MSKRKAPKRTRIIAPTAAATTSIPRIRECLIIINLTCNVYNAFMLSPAKNAKNLKWTGLLWDSASLSEPDDATPMAQLLMKDDSIYSRGRVVRELQKMAYNEGYTHCEVRDYSFGDSGFFLPLFNAPLPDPTSLFF